ncbi:MAG: patatin-like phospholipase family protein [Syntrophomonadaceae bacterium]
MQPLNIRVEAVASFLIAGDFMKKIGLALGGGGLKGLAHIGVLQVLHDNHIPVGCVSGTSSGSIIAALLACGMSPYRMADVVLRLKTKDYIDYDLTGIMAYLLTLLVPGVKGHLDGIIKGNKLEQLVFRLTRGLRLAEARLPLAIIACNIDSGHQVVFTNQAIANTDEEMVIVNNAFLSEAVRASTSIPATFVPKFFKGMQLVDGGIKEVVPVSVQKSLGSEYTVAVNLGRELYHEKVVGLPAIVSRSISIMTYETADLSQQFYADMILTPELNDIHLDDIHKAPQIIRAGRQVMEDNLAQLIKEIQAR